MQGSSETVLQEQNSLIRRWYDSATNAYLKTGKQQPQSTSPAVEAQISKVFESVAAGNPSDTVNQICEHYNLSSDSPQPVGQSIVRQILFGVGALPYSVWMNTISWPGDVERIKSTWVPRIIGTVRANETPASFDGGGALWRTYGRNVTDTKGNFVRFSREPRLAFVYGWGKGLRRLYGTYLATAERICIDGFICVAVQRIKPSTDVASGMVTGVDPIIFEAVIQNITWIPMAIGSVDLAGQYLTIGGDQPAGELTFFMHMNETGDYSTRKITLSEISAWQMQIINWKKTGVNVGEESSTLPAKLAQRRYWQLVTAVKYASMSDNAFTNLIQAIDSLNNLLNEGNRIPTSDTKIYMPDYSGRAVPQKSLPEVTSVPLPAAVNQQKLLQDAFAF